MKTPVIHGIELQTPDDVRAALIYHCGKDHTIMALAEIFNDYAGAVVGITDNNRVVYDYNKMVQIIMERDGITKQEAEEYLEYNELNTLSNKPYTPLIIYPVMYLDKEGEEK